MNFSSPSDILLILVGIGALLALPVLYKGFSRRGKGIKHEKNFLIQRAPQLASILAILLVAISMLFHNEILKSFPGMIPFVVLGLDGNLEGPALIISWLGIAILVCGLIFMIGAWYSLGEFFSTDAEVMEKQTVRNTGLFGQVMHPAYSGIIQSLFGVSLVATSMPCALFVMVVVAPLWLRRGKYEEAMLVKALGEPYREYGEKMQWRRLIPRFIPFGV